MSLNELFYRIQNGRFAKFNTWLDKLTFLHILVLWFTIIIVFGATYFYFTSTTGFLYYGADQQPVQELADSIYFSFITATTTGFGDIIPKGHFKIVAIIEVTLGLLLIALVTSKFVSIKQNVILNEMYDISFNEQIGRLRSSLLLFRQHLTGMIDKIEEKTITKREVTEIYNFTSSFEDTLHEIASMVEPEKKTHFTKEIGLLETELIFNSVTSSFEKIAELIAHLNGQSLEWRRDVTIHSLKKGLEANNRLWKILNRTKNLPAITIQEMTTKNKIVIEGINKELWI